jgi:gamma-glutamylcysteine synthetase
LGDGPAPTRGVMVDAGPDLEGLVMGVRISRTTNQQPVGYPTVSPEAPGDGPPLDFPAARDHLSEAALTAAPVGPVGLELERHAVDLADPGAVVSWRRLNAVTSELALPGGSRLTLEPGGQVELSTAVGTDCAAAVAALQADDAVLTAALRTAGIGLHSSGIDPARSSVRIHPGERYAAMAGYFHAA